MLDIRHRGTLSGSVSYIYNITPRLLGAAGPHEFVILHHDEQQLRLARLRARRYARSRVPNRRSLTK